MSWIAVAVVGGSILGGAIQGNAAESAASTQAGAAEQAAQIGQQEFQTITQQESPFMQGGYGALGALEYGLGIGPQTAPATTSTLGITGPSGGSSIPIGSYSGSLYGGYPNGWATVGQGMPNGPQYSTPVGAAGTGLGYGSLLAPFNASMMQQYSPAYQFQKQQGLQGVLNSDATSVGALSGAASKDLIDFNQGLANTAFANAFGQYQTQQGNIYQRLAGLTQLGQAAAANTGQQGTALTGQIGQSITNAGTAASAGQVGSANAWSGAISSAMPWLAYGGNSASLNNASNWDTENPSNFQDFTPSDRRLKEDIVKVGTLESGLPIYRFRYKGDAITRLGVMADEVEKIFPEAVVKGTQGFKMVDYGKIR